jgi:hypothetical protein
MENSSTQKILPPPGRFLKRDDLRALLMPLLLLAVSGATPEEDRKHSPPQSREATPRTLPPRESGDQKNSPAGAKSKDAKKPSPTTPSDVPPVQIEFDKDPAIGIFRQGTNESKRLFEASKALREALRQATRGNKGKDQSASHEGPEKGVFDGVGSLSPRERRQLRWHMSFRTKSGEDYVNQLHALGAYIVLPLSDSPPRFLVIRDLKHPDKAREDDISTLNRMYWTDARPESVAALCQALGIKSVPSQFHAFFPLELEATLLKHEQDYFQNRIPQATRDQVKARLKARGVDVRSDEDLVQETRFDVVPSGGRYEVRVRKVTLRQQ